MDTGSVQKQSNWSNIWVVVMDLKVYGTNKNEMFNHHLKGLGVTT